MSPQPSLLIHAPSGPASSSPRPRTGDMERPHALAEAGLIDAIALLRAVDLRRPVYSGRAQSARRVEVSVVIHAADLDQVLDDQGRAAQAQSGVLDEVRPTLQPFAWIGVSTTSRGIPAIRSYVSTLQQNGLTSGNDGSQGN
jgi:hypothetical protein